MDADYVDQLVKRGVISDDVAARMMTHQPEQPNPVTPIVQRARDFLTSGDFSPVHEPGTPPADYLRELARNPDILAKNIDQANQFNFGGMARPTFSQKNPAMAAKVDDLIRRGYTVQAITDETGVGGSTINNHLQRTGQKTAAAENPSSWTPEKEAGLIADYNKGMSHPALAEKYDSTPGAIWSKLTSLGKAGKLDYVKRPPSFRQSPDRQALLKQRIEERRSYGEIARDPNLGASEASTISKHARILQELGILPKDYAPQNGFGVTPQGRGLATRGKTPTLPQLKSQAGPAPELDEDMAKTLAKYLKFGT